MAAALRVGSGPIAHLAVLTRKGEPAQVVAADASGSAVMFPAP